MEILIGFLFLTSLGSLLAALSTLLLAPPRDQILQEIAQAQHAEAFARWERFAQDIQQANEAREQRRAAGRELQDVAQQVARPQEMPPLVNDLQGSVPPLHVYYGVTRDAFPDVLRDGILPAGADRVILYRDVQTALTRARPLGDFVILRIRANDAFQRGLVFADGIAGTLTCPRVDPSFFDVDWAIQEYMARTENRAR